MPDNRPFGANNLYVQKSPSLYDSHKLIPHVQYKKIKQIEMLTQAGQQNPKHGQSKHNNIVLDEKPRKEQSTGVSPVVSSEVLRVVPGYNTSGRSPELDGSPAHLDLAFKGGGQDGELSNRRQEIIPGPINAMRSFDLKSIDENKKEIGKKGTPIMGQ